MISLLAGLFITSAWMAEAKLGNIIEQKPGFAVVELFTSQGCSSCPPADSLVADLLRERKKDAVYVLCYHVDYWDHIGWKDTYSNHAYTEKQEKYVKDLGLESVYTPQMIVNGRSGFNGSDRALSYMSITNGLKQTPVAHIELSAIEVINGKVEGKLLVKGGNDKCQIILALVEKAATVEIKKGENKGRSLKYANTVRAYLTLNADADKFSMAMPAGLTPGSSELIAYIQDNESSAILHACKSALQ